jgi:hypothetical protein
LIAVKSGCVFCSITISSGVVRIGTMPTRAATAVNGSLQALPVEGHLDE